MTAIQPLSNLRQPILERGSLIAAIAAAVDRTHGFAAAKIGPSIEAVLAFHTLSKRLGTTAERPPQLIIRAFKQASWHGLKNSGIYPATPKFYVHFAEFYEERLAELDILGIFEDTWQVRDTVLENFSHPPLIDYRELEPDRSCPTREECCYLRCFANRRILIVCPFADLLAERANQDTFEKVWAKIGKRWFQPANVEGVEFPYGFLSSTHDRYPTVLDLFDHIVAQIRRRDFDVAMVGAAGLAIPIVSEVKRMGKVAIDLGGHLQILFGVLGKRWRQWPKWHDRYFNDAWISMPESYRPPVDDVCDCGAYW